MSFKAFMITYDDLPNTFWILQKYNARQGRRVPLLSVYERHRCAQCGKIDEYAALRAGVSDSVRLRTGWDVGCSPEGLMLVSQRFRAVIVEAGIAGIEFQPIPQSREHFVVLPLHVAPTDHACCAKHGMKFLNKCPRCGRYEETASGWPFSVCMELPVNERTIFASAIQCEGPSGIRATFYTSELVCGILGDARLDGLNSFIEV